MWIYEITNPRISRDGVTLTTDCYSGHGDGLNNVAMCSVRNVGPLPPGLWHMVKVVDSPHTGHFTITLEPDPTTDTQGRVGIDCHGDEIAHPGQHLASDGCLIAPLDPRVTMWNSGDHLLQVVPALEEMQMVTDPELGL